MLIKWAAVVGFPQYQVSNEGQVRRRENGLPRSGRRAGDSLTPWSDKHGYQWVCLCAGRTKAKRRVHRLVAEAFIGAPPRAGLHVAHWDGNPRNNLVSNLRWATARENAEDRWRHGTQTSGGLSHASALTDDQARSIRERYIKTAAAPAILAKEYGVSDSTIRNCLRGRTYAAAGGPTVRAIARSDIGRKKTLSKAHLEAVRRVKGKTTPETRAAIKRDRRQGGTLKEIGARYGINYATVHQIVTGKTWREK